MKLNCNFIVLDSMTGDANEFDQTIDEVSPAAISLALRQNLLDRSCICPDCTPVTLDEIADHEILSLTRTPQGWSFTAYDTSEGVVVVGLLFVRSSTVR